MTWNELMDEHDLPHNTWWQDFSIADRFGEKAINDTYKTIFYWKDDVKMFTAAVFALNHKCWAYADTNPVLSTLYSDLFYKAQDFGYDHFKGEDLRFFWKTLD